MSSCYRIYVNRLIEADTAFHKAIYLASNNPILLIMLWIQTLYYSNILVAKVFGMSTNNCLMPVIVTLPPIGHTDLARESLVRNLEDSQLNNESLTS